MNVEIRKAIPEDAEIIIDINIKVWNNIYKDLIPKKIIDNLNFFYKENQEQGTGINKKEKLIPV